jgi:hypothetical protein
MNDTDARLSHPWHQEEASEHAPAEEGLMGLYQRPDSDVYWISYNGSDGQRVRESTRTTDKEAAKRLLKDRRGPRRAWGGLAAAPRSDYLRRGESRSHRLVQDERQPRSRRGRSSSEAPRHLLLEAAAGHDHARHRDPVRRGAAGRPDGRRGRDDRRRLAGEKSCCGSPQKCGDRVRPSRFPVTLTSVAVGGVLQLLD